VNDVEMSASYNNADQRVHVTHVAEAAGPHQAAEPGV